MAVPKGLEVLAAEYRATDKVPVEARSFGFWDQFALWFAAASLPAAWLYGGYMTGAYGLPGAIVLIFVVSTVTFVPWAYIGHIAADKGASSVTLLRPAFGLRGSKLPSVFYLFFGYGWAAVNVFIAAISTSFVLKLTLGWPSAFDPAAPVPNYFMIPSILLVCILQGFFATAGHRAIRLLNWISTVALVALGAYATYIVLKDFDFGALIAWRPASPLSFTISGGALGGGFTYVLTVPLLVDLLIAYNWTWEFIGDFSRFARTKRAGTWGPFAGASLAQYWFFSVGALMTVAFLATAPPGSPVNFAAISDPSYKATQLGFGVGAYLIILFATISTNAGNIYASALGISNIATRWKVSMRRLLLLSALVVVPLALLPLLQTNFVFTYIFFLDFLGAIVVPLWTLTLVDYFLVKKGKYHDDLFLSEGGYYWYRGGWNWPAVVTLLAGAGVYWVLAFAVPVLRETITAAVPTIVFVSLVYYVWGKSVWTRRLQVLRHRRLVEEAT